MRSGKSRFAERLALESGLSVTYVATATPSDDEMRRRIAAHRSRRPSSWRTLEVRLGIPQALEGAGIFEGLVLLEDLGLLVSNVLGAHWDDALDAPALGFEQATEREIAALLAMVEHGQYRWVVVTNEVGMGMVPVTPLGRAFADALGLANLRMGEVSDRVFLVVAGHALDVTTLGQRVE
jgi:adenosylcobinamide kinase/adenosylcobinamide-phosphate guanylyltransferase